MTTSHPARIFVCDDEELIRWSLVEHLRSLGHEVTEAFDGQDCLDKLASSTPDLLVTDLKMPRVDGMELLRRIREQGLELPAIVITAHGDLDAGIEATRLGARAFVSKPFDLREMSLAIEKVLEHHRLETEVRYLREQTAGSYGRLIGESAPMKRLTQVLAKLEGVGASTVLLIGESGTGKDVVAHAIHEAGLRKDGPMMEVDCAGIQETLIESELFGHERGSFTDAKTTKRGMFEAARGGTLFLDEIAEMSLGTQAKLLRALESRRFKRVGGLTDIHLDATVIAATNRDLQKEVAAGKFREDLYFRLAVIRIDVPPLRERRDDIPLLVDHFLKRFNEEFRRHIRGVSEAAMQKLQLYAWPGNVRELRNVMERVVLLEAEDVVELEHLPPEIRFGSIKAVAVPSNEEDIALPEKGVNLERLERSLLKQALDRTHGNQSAAARLLGISRYALRYRLERLEEDAKKGSETA
jgi:two-component system, NtrC family, response regulator AtoC